MIFYRKLYRYLLDWKSRTDRKPLIIRGARQVGKSTLVTDFSKEFRYFISVNLEKKDDKEVFNSIDNIKDIVNALFLRSGIPYTEEPTLIFIDEIQESPAAITHLRYFLEDYPQLYVIAAGSLLEFALNETAAFPVGRVEQVVLHPFDFEEFLLATGRKDLLDELTVIPVNRYAHEVFMKQFNDYAIIGGMPEVVKRYAEESNFINLSHIYSNLWQSYRDDIEKYTRNNTERKVIRHIIDTAPAEKDRITMAGFGNSMYRSREVSEALHALDMARIIQLVYPVTSTEPPAVPDIKRKPRLQFLDTGLLNHTLGIQADMIGLKDISGFYRGRIIQHLTAQQLQAQTTAPGYKPAFWVREKANSNAEVDLICQYGKYFIPVEVKAGSQGMLRSLHQFVEKSKHKYAIRVLGNLFSVEKVKTPGGVPYLLMNIPYYASTRLNEYIRWFMENY
jgi:predicted AAA+ superfamily ATPase